jgi:uncharacterized damage-inducible protein DinB
MTSADAARVLTRELAAVQREIALFPDDTTVWSTAPGMPNSAGNLALHLAGNAQHYIGAMLGRSGYVRDRDAEFARRAGTREELRAELDRAIAAVQQALPTLPAEVLAEPVAVPGIPPMPWGQFLIHLCAHAGYHLGQIDYARRVLTGDSRSAATLPMGELVTDSAVS